MSKWYFVDDEDDDDDDDDDNADDDADALDDDDEDDSTPTFDEKMPRGAASPATPKRDANPPTSTTTARSIITLFARSQHGR